MSEAITVGETAGAEPYTLPVEELLTCRGFVTGKSGSGKSNTGSVIAEELLARDLPILIVDVDGEYFGLKEEFEILHVGATEQCDLQVGPEHAGRLAELALDQLVPLIVDTSGYLDQDVADELIASLSRELFAREQDAQQPFLMLVEEIHEYIPQQGSPGDVGDALIRVAKRGRKRGLGIIGLSQRPANVQKDFITQAELLVWHRLTWDNDTDVVARVIDRGHADAAEDLKDGEAFVQADWREETVETVQFRRKRTFDAGDRPGLDDTEQPELQSIDEDLVAELEEISEQHQRRQDRIAQLESQLKAKDERITELKEKLEDAQDLQRLGEAFVDAAQSGDADVESEQTELLEEKNERIADLRDRVAELEDKLAAVREEREELSDEVERLSAVEERVEHAEQIEETLERVREIVGVEVQAEADGQRVAELQRDLQEKEERIAELEERLAEQPSGRADSDLATLIEHEAIQRAVRKAADESDRSHKHFDRVLAVLASADGGPHDVDEITPLIDASETTARTVLKDLHTVGVVRREEDGRSYQYALDEEFLRRRLEVFEVDEATTGGAS